MDLSIIIINWNSKAYLRDCLKSLNQGAKGLDYEVFVVDNASYDGAAEMVAGEFPHVEFIQSQSNLGFSGGNNCAARQAGGDFLLFLNPDTVVEGNSLVKLVEVLRSRPEAKIVGARLLNSDRTVQTSCIQSFPTIANQMLDCDLLRRWFPRSRLWGMAALFHDSQEPTAVEAISGACLMIKRDLFERLGGFDKRYFMYSEDIDLAFRVHLAGYKCYYVPTSMVLHHGAGSSQNARSAFSNVMIRESVYRFMRLHRGRLAATGFRVAIGFSALLRLPLVSVARPFCKQTSTERQSSARKWFSIFRWSLGMEPWATKQWPS